MGDIYENFHECSGRAPEMEDLYGSASKGICRWGKGQTVDGHKVLPQVIHRGALNLHIPIVYTSVNSHASEGGLNDLIHDDVIRTTIRTLNSISSLNRDNLRKALENQGIPASKVEAVCSHGSGELAGAVEQYTKSLPKSYGQLLIQEYRNFESAAREGADFEDFSLSTARSQEITWKASPGLKFKIFPVERLQVVMTQYGFQRIDPINGTQIGVAHVEGGKDWYPAVKVIGEGLYIHVEGNGFNLRGQRAKQWAGFFESKTHQREQKPKGGLQESEETNFERNPIHVWWHTLSHKLMTILSIDSGYSSGSLRERVYCDGDTGAVLVYAAQPGSDGGLGGLIGLIEHTSEIIESACISSLLCSNDPLCGQTELGEQSMTGAACYACELIPETSCEQRNLWLDRRILIENNPFVAMS
jgi:uncharacterized protein DUF1998